MMKSKFMTHCVQSVVGRLGNKAMWDEGRVADHLDQKFISCQLETSLQQGEARLSDFSLVDHAGRLTTDVHTQVIATSNLDTFV